MKRTIAAAALLVTMAACGGANKGSLENVQWKLVKANGIPADAIDREADFFTMTFDAAQQTVAGRTNCNRFFGRYEVKGREIDFENMGMTRMACPEMEYETVFTHILDEADRYEIRGGELRLYDDKHELAMFRAMDADTEPAAAESADDMPANAKAGNDTGNGAAVNGQMRTQTKEHVEERKEMRDGKADRK